MLSPFSPVKRFGLRVYSVSQGLTSLGSRPYVPVVRLVDGVLDFKNLICELMGWNGDSQMDKDVRLGMTPTGIRAKFYFNNANYRKIELQIQ